MRVISCNSLTDSSSFSSKATIRRRVTSERARRDFKVLLMKKSVDEPCQLIHRFSLMQHIRFAAAAWAFLPPANHPRTICISVSRSRFPESATVNTGQASGAHRELKKLPQVSLIRQPFSH